MNNLTWLLVIICIFSYILLKKKKKDKDKDVKNNDIAVPTAYFGNKQSAPVRGVEVVSIPFPTEVNETHNEFTEFDIISEGQLNRTIDVMSDDGRKVSYIGAISRGDRVIFYLTY